MDHGFSIVSKKIITKLNVIQTFSHLIVQEFQSLDASFEMLFFPPRAHRNVEGRGRPRTRLIGVIMSKAGDG